MNRLGSYCLLSIDYFRYSYDQTDKDVVNYLDMFRVHTVTLLQKVSSDTSADVSLSAVPLWVCPA